MARHSIPRPRDTFEERERKAAARFVGLEDLATEYGRDRAWLRRVVLSGRSVEDVRAELDGAIRRQQELAAQTEIRPLPAGAAWRAPGTTAGTRHGDERVAGALALMGRTDLAAAYCRDHDVDARRITFTSARDGLNRLVGAFVPNVDELHRVILEGAAVPVWGGMPAAFPRADFGPAVRDASTVLLTHDWGMRGEVWRAASRPVRTATLKTHRAYVAASGGVSLHRIGEAGEPRTADPDFAGWPYVDLAYPPEGAGRAEKLFPTVERLVDGGLEQIGSWLSGVVAGWNDAFDAAAVTALAGAPESSSATTRHYGDAVETLNQQAINGRRLGSSRPLVLASESLRSDIATLSPGLRTASDDDRVLFSRVIHSTEVGADWVCLVHPRFLPLAVGHTDGLDPLFDVGPYTRPDGRSATGLMVRLNVTEPALIQTAGTSRVGLGAVRVTVSGE